jgi:RimJ/RimL family protein N-acetyltransferase
MGRLPQRVEADRIVLRRWQVADAETQQQAMLSRWERDWAAGGDALLGVFLDGAVAGSCGLHRRQGHRTLEIGYWIHVSFLGWGLGTKVAAMLTEAAFSLPEVTATEIHHDKANTVSARIPRRLGYRFLGESPDIVEAPGEVGIDCAWRFPRSELPALIRSCENGE